MSKDLTSYISRSLSTMVILATLQSISSASGYQLIKTIKEWTGDIISFRTGTIYPHIEKLVKAGFIEKEFENLETQNKAIRQKAVYSLSVNGIKEVNKMRDEWQTVSTEIDKILGGTYNEL